MEAARPGLRRLDAEVRHLLGVGRVHARRDGGAEADGRVTTISAERDSDHTRPDWGMLSCECGCDSQRPTATCRSLMAGRSRLRRPFGELWNVFRFYEDS